MGQLYIPGEKEIKGPWFIGLDELEELDKIFEFIDSKITESTNMEIDELARAAVQKGEYEDIDTAVTRLRKYQFDTSRKVKKVDIISIDEKRLTDTTLMGILKDAKLKDFKPKELTLEVGFMHLNQFYLNIRRRSDGIISYRVKCFDQNIEDEIRYKIDTWLDKHHPNKPLQIWSEYSFLLFIISFLLVGLSAPRIVSFELPDFKTNYKNEINQIIKSGVNKENELKSIELLLKYSTDYQPYNIKSIKKINSLATKILLISLFILLISSFKPKTTIGIGKHKSLIKIYKFYTSLVLITLPAVFIIAPLFEWIKRFLEI